MKALFIIIGESFRTGGWLSRERGDIHTYEDQKLACQSHMKFINFINLKFKITSDLIVDTYHTQYADEMLEWYRPNLVNSYIHHGPAIGYENMYKHSLDLVDDLDYYDFVHFIRIDIFLKPFFSKVFRLSESNLQYAFRTNPVPLIENIPRLNDMMLYVPKMHFHLLKNKVVLFHDLWIWGLLQRLKMTKYVRLYSNTFHNSNTQFDWNPIFRIVNREEAKKWDWEGYISRKLNEEPVFAF